MSSHLLNTIRRPLGFLPTVLCILGFWSNQAQAQLDTEFWFAPPELTASTNEASRRDRPIQLVISTLEKPATVQIMQPADLTFTPIVLQMEANATEIVNLTSFLDRLESKPHNTVLKTGLYIKSSASISAYYEIKSPNNTDIFALKGANATGRLFFTPFQTHWDNGLMNGNIVYNPTTYASFDIVATDDSTNVTITPARPIMGHPAGVPFTIQLNRGQVYSCRAIDRFGANRPVGSKIESDKDIAVTVKDDMLQFNPPNAGADIAGDQLVPVDYTGTDYVFVKGGLNNDGDRVYILATEDNTVIRINGNPIPLATLQHGEQYELQLTEASYFLKASKRVYAWHISGLGDQVAGAIIPALICTGTNQIGFTRTTPNTYIINVITKEVAKDKFTLNGNPNLVPASAFSPVQGSNGWVYARITFSTSQVPSGTTLLLKNSSSELFHVGVTNYASSIGSNYGYFSNYSRLNLGTDRSLCVGDTAVLDAGPAKTQYLWSTGETTRFIETLNPGNYWVRTLSGSSCPKSDTIRVKFYEPSFNIGPDDTICTGGSTLIQPDGVFTFTWQDGTTNQTYLATQPGVYWAQVADFQGCTTRDSLIISESPRPATPEATPGDTVCFGGSVALSMSDSPGASYAWMSPTDEVISGKTITVNTGSQPTGAYKAFVKVAGCESLFDTSYVDVNQPPAISLGNDTVLCNLVGSVKLDPVKHMDGLQYLWDDGSTDSSRTVSVSGLYFVKVTNTSGCESFDTIRVTYQPLPLSVTFTGSTTFCANSAASFGVVAQPGIDYEWTGPGGFSATGSTININSIQAAMAGTYTVTPNQNGCSGPSANLPIIVNVSPTINLGSDTSACTAFSLVLDPVAHGGGLTYQWSDNSTDSTLAISQEGTYTVQVSNGLCVSRDTLLVDFGVGPGSVTFTGLSTFCQGSIGFFGVIAVPGESYTWSGPNGFVSNSNSILINNIQPSQAGVYAVTPSKEGCAGSTSSLTITVSPVPTISLGPDAVVCPLGSLILDPILAGGEEIFYIWGDGSADSTLSVSTPGTYSVVVTTDGLCFARDTISVTGGTGPDPVSITGINTYCSGTNASFGITPQTNALYQWTGPNGFTFNGPLVSISSIQLSQSGFYKVMPSLNGCPGPADSVEISVTASPVISLGADVSTCNGPALTLDPIQNGTGLTYLWSTSSTDSSISVNASGQYSVTVSAGICSSSDTIDLIFGTTPAPVVFTGNTTYCEGNPVLFGVSPEVGVSYTWSGPGGFSSSGNQVLIASGSVVQSGFYKVIPVSGSCIGASDSVEIIIRLAPAVSLGADVVACTGTVVELDPTPAGAGYTYLWSTTSTDSSIMVSASGQYIVSVSTGLCTATDTIEVAFGTAPEAVVFSGDTAYCQGENAGFGVTASSGVTYLWTGPNGFAFTGSTVSFSAIQLNQAGQYTVTPQVGTCIGNDSSITIQVSATPVAELGNTITACPGASVTLDPTPTGSGLTYLWSTTSTDTSIVVLTTGSYNVTVSSGAGCTDSDTVQVTFTAPPAAPAISGNTVFCQGGMVEFGASPVTGVSYTWTGPNGFTFGGPAVSIPNVQPAMAGTYTVTPSLAGCSGTSASITISVGPGPAVNLGADDTLCGSTPITLDPGLALPGYTYLWNFGSTDTSITVNQTGQYAVTVSFGGCSGTDTIDLLFVSPPLPVTIVGNELQCEGTQLTLDIQGAQPDVIYQWTGPNGFTATGFPVTTPMLTNSSSGVYEVTPARFGCAGFVSSLNVVVNPTPDPNLGLDLGACAGISFTLDPIAQSDGLTFEWNNGSTDTSLIVSQSGTYIVKISNAFNCIGRDTILVTLDPIPLSVLFEGDSVFCSGENAVFGVASQLLVQNTWTGPNGFTATGNSLSLGNIQPLQSGYYVVQPVLNGCLGFKDSLRVRVGEKPVFSLGSDTSFCGSGSYTIGVPPVFGQTYQWNTGDQSSQITVGVSNLYILTVTGSEQCQAIDTVAILFNQAPQPLQVLSGTQTVCEGAPYRFEVAAQPSESYGWSGPNGYLQTGALVVGTAQPIMSGTYTVQSFRNGCPGEVLEVVLTVNPLPALSVSGDTLVCKGIVKTITATTTQGVQLLWSNLTNGSSANFGVGTHWVRATLAGCTVSDTFSLRNSGPVAAFAATPSDEIVLYETTHFTDQSVRGAQPLAGWEWDLGFSQIQRTQNAHYVYTYGDSVNVQLMVWDAAGCFDTLSRRYGIQSAKGWFIPTLITPNGDGKNDLFEIRDLALYPGTSVTLYDRWGKKVFESGDYRNEWKTANHREGVYFYEVKRSDGQEFKGYITLQP